MHILLLESLTGKITLEDSKFLNSVKIRFFFSQNYKKAVDTLVEYTNFMGMENIQDK